jgi:hypothetical protein
MRMAPAQEMPNDRPLLDGNLGTVPSPRRARRLRRAPSTTQPFPLSEPRRRGKAGERSTGCGNPRPGGGTPPPTSPPTISPPSLWGGGPLRSAPSPLQELQRQTTHQHGLIRKKAAHHFTTNLLGTAGESGKKVQTLPPSQTLSTPLFFWLRV